MVGGATARVAAVINGQTDFTMVTEPGKLQGENAGMKVIIDMAKLKIPFQFSCTVASGKLIRENPKLVETMVKSLAEAVHFFKTNKKESIRIMNGGLVFDEQKTMEQRSAYYNLKMIFAPRSGTAIAPVLLAIGHNESRRVEKFLLRAP